MGRIPAASDLQPEDHDALNALEERLAREDADAARVGLLGETWAAERYWELHVRAQRLGHRLWAAKFRELHLLAVANASHARETSRFASGQLEKVAERRAREKAEGKLRGRPPTGNRHAARAAFLKARNDGAKVETAIAAAAQAGRFKSMSRVWELKKAEGW